MDLSNWGNEKLIESFLLAGDHLKAQNNINPNFAAESREKNSEFALALQQEIKREISKRRLTIEREFKKIREKKNINEETLSLFLENNSMTRKGNAFLLEKDSKKQESLTRKPETGRRKMR